MFAGIPWPVSEEVKKKDEAYKLQGEMMILYLTHTCTGMHWRPLTVPSTSGNTHLKLNKFQEAVDCYTNAIKLDASNATYFCNRYVCTYYVLDNMVLCKLLLSKLNRVVWSVSYRIMMFEMTMWGTWCSWDGNTGRWKKRRLNGGWGRSPPTNIMDRTLHY